LGLTRVLDGTGVAERRLTVKDITTPSLTFDITTATSSTPSV